MVKSSNAGKDTKEEGHLPMHVAVIMDGNGRWAKKRGFARSMGHAAGGRTFRDIATYLNELGVKYYSVFAFSTENWKRPTEEVNAIMGLFRKYLIDAVEEILKNNISIKIMGDQSAFSSEILRLAENVDRLSKNSTGLQINVHINYGSRSEIVMAAKKIAADVKSGALLAENINEQTLSDYLYTKGISDPDLIIRTGGEMRVSNFLLWQGAYSEYYFTDVLWPDFDRAEMDKALEAYARRTRRFGGI